MYSGERFNLDYSEIVSALLSNTNKQRIAIKNSKLWRNKLCDVAATEILKKGIRPESNEF